MSYEYDGQTYNSKNWNTNIWCDPHNSGDVSLLIDSQHLCIFVDWLLTSCIFVDWLWTSLYLCWLTLDICVPLLIDSGHLCTFVDWLCPRHRRIKSLGIVPPRVWGNPAEVQLPPPSFQSKVLQHNVGQIQSNFCLLCDREMLQKAWLTQSQFRIWMVFNFLLSEMCKTHCSARNNGRECSKFPCRVCFFF